MSGIFILETNLDVETQSIANTIFNDNITFPIINFSQITKTLPVYTGIPSDTSYSISPITEFFYLKMSGVAQITLNNSTINLVFIADRWFSFGGAFNSIIITNLDSNNPLEFNVAYS